MGRMGTAAEVADVVAFLFRYVMAAAGDVSLVLTAASSDESRYMSGSIIEITGGRPT